MLSFGLVTAFLSPVQATHLRGAVGSIVYDHTAKTVTITSTMVERKDACPTSGSSGSLCTYFAFPTMYQVNRTTGTTTSVQACVGQSTTPTSSLYDNTSQPLYNIFTTTFVINVACPNFSTSFDYLFSQTGSNRIGGIKNTTNQVIEFEGQIRIDGTVDRKAPIYNTGYMTNIQYNESPSFIFSTNLNATGQNGSGQDGYSVTYALVTSVVSGVGGYGASAIPCSNFNTSNGILQIGIAFCSLATYQAAFKGGTDTTPIYYVLKTTAKDAIGQFTTRDVLLSFSNTSNNAPTLTRTPSTNPLTISASATTTITYNAADADAAQKLVFSSNTLPAWATISPTPGTLSVANSASMTLTLSPPTGTNFAGTFLISATDNGAFPLSATNQLDLTVGTGQLPPGPPGTPTTSGSTATFTEPTTGGAVVSYSAVATSTTGSGTLTATSCAAPVSPGSTRTCAFASSLAGYAVVITATNAEGSASSLSSVTPPVLYTSISTLSWTQNSAPSSNYTLSQTGAPIQSYTISPALSTAGLTFSTVTGLITGTPTAALSATPYTITGSTGGATPVLSNGVVVTLTVVAASVATKLAQTITFPYMGRFPKLIAAPTVPTVNTMPGSRSESVV